VKVLYSVIVNYNNKTVYMVSTYSKEGQMKEYRNCRAEYYEPSYNVCLYETTLDN
jgi:hypothetical protein